VRGEQVSIQDVGNALWLDAWARCPLTSTMQIWHRQSISWEKGFRRAFVITRSVDLSPDQLPQTGSILVSMSAIGWLTAVRVCEKSCLWTLPAWGGEWKRDEMHKRREQAQLKMPFEEAAEKECGVPILVTLDCFCRQRQSVSQDHISGFSGTRRMTLRQQILFELWKTLLSSANYARVDGFDPQVLKYLSKKTR